MGLPEMLKKPTTEGIAMSKNAYEERERMTKQPPPIKVEEAKSPLNQELCEIDAKYVVAPSQKLLDQRLDVLVRMMVK
jgi:hypothetical protein